MGGGCHPLGVESGQTGGEEVGNNDGWVIEKNPPNASVSFLGYFFL